MDYDWAENIHHISFGLISVDGEKMSTRSGRVVLLEDVLDEAVTKAYHQIDEKNPGLENKEEVAEQVGIGAVIFNDLHNDRQNDFNFDLDAIVQFEGETGPYVQYSRARAMSILEKAEEQNIDISFDEGENLSDDYSWSLLQDIETFPHVLNRALENNEPSVIARHVMKLATDFNKFYANIRVLDEHPERSQRLALTRAITILIKEELRLLGVAAPDEM
jgi:arginyl-tRNA synthetase